MTLEQFQSATPYIQRNLVRHQGVLLAERKQFSQATLLFQVEGFYVEVLYDYDSTRILNMRSFDSTDELDEYLETIDVRELTRCG